MSNRALRLITESETAEILDISPRTLQRWRTEGGPIDFKKIGRSVKYVEEEVLDYIERATRRSTSDPGPEDE